MKSVDRIFCWIYIAEREMAKFTIKNRITTFMVIFTVLLVGAFVAIQAYNQLATMTVHNLVRARLGARLAKTSLEEAISKTASRTLQRDFLRSTLAELSDGKIIDDAKIFTPDGRIVAAGEPGCLGQSASAPQKREIENALCCAREGKWFSSRVSARLFELYVPLESNGAHEYIAALSFSLGNMLDALKQVYVPALITAFVVILLNAGLGVFLQKTIIGPVRALDGATRVIADGDLEHRVSVKTGDELEDLALRFNDMTVALIKMRERALNANPLTKLPGNVMIAEDVERRIAQGKKFVAVHTDLDNFKAYNDKYGLAKGDEAIKLTAQILRESVKDKGNADDFLGHEGGDDFVLVTTPDKAEDVTSYITSEFDKRIRDLYNEEDKAKGYIVAKLRTGETAKLPLMSISLAGISNQLRQIKSYAEVTNIGIEVKKKAKSIEGSVFVLDKRLETSA